jgi:hypothetical protein
MAIGTVTLTEGVAVGGVPSAPVFMTQISFAGETAYPAGGMLGLQTAVRLATKDSRTVKGIVGMDCGGYVPVWVPATGAVKVYYGNFDASDGPLIELPDPTDIHTITFNLLVFCE